MASALLAVVVLHPLRIALLASLLCLSPALAGCLGNDIWREPFDWHAKAEFGESLDGAQAFASAMAGLAQQAAQTGQDQVIGTVEDLPDGVVFQNLRDFMESQSPGSGDQLDGGVRTITDEAGNAYANLTGPMADAYGQAMEPLFGTVEPVVVRMAERTTRVRLTLDVLLDNPAGEPGENPTPVNTIEVIVKDARGATKAHYQLDTTRHLQDQFVTGTFGDRNEVREHWGGDWQVEVFATGTGAWSLVMEGYEPRHDDWKYWQFWRSEKRQVVGE